MPTVHLGNTSVLESRRDELDQLVSGARRDLGSQVTTVQIPDEVGLVDQVKAVQDLWPYHSDKPPAWVESDDTNLQGVLADTFQTKAGRPASFKEGKR